MQLQFNSITDIILQKLKPLFSYLFHGLRLFIFRGNSRSVCTKINRK